MNTSDIKSPLSTLAALLAERGPVPTVRVSTARTGSVGYPYWDAVRYELRLSPDGHPTHYALERVTRVRRSVRLAEQDAEQLAEREGRVFLVRGPGRIREAEVDYLLHAIEALAARESLASEGGA